MYLSKMEINYISSMTMLAMDDIRNNNPEHPEVYSSVLNDYFEFLSTLREDSNELRYAKYFWFIELRESLTSEDTSCEEVIESVKNYFIDVYSYDYENIPLVIKECFHSLDNKDMSDKIYKEGNEIFENRLNLKGFEKSEEYQNAVFLFLNKYKDKLKDNKCLLN